MSVCFGRSRGREKKYVSWLLLGEELELKALCKSNLLSLTYSWYLFFVFHAPWLMKTSGLQIPYFSFHSG